MIKSIKLTNFQIHKKTILEFKDGLNIIVGDSDTGKSSILKGLYWLKYNRPSGEPFRNFTSKQDEEVSISIETDKGTLKRIKKEGFNGYIINGKELKDIRLSVPDEVSTFLNISDINIQTQFDPIFLLSVSKQEASRYINNLVRLEDADVILDLVNKNVRSLNDEVKNIEEDIKKQHSEIEKLSFLEGLKLLVFETKELEEKFIKQEKVRERLLFIKDNIKERKTIPIGFEEVESLIIKERNILNQITFLSHVRKSIKEFHILIKENETRIKELTEKLPEICPLCGR
jgi:exonuclease SbcC